MPFPTHRGREAAPIRALPALALLALAASPALAALPRDACPDLVLENAVGVVAANVVLAEDGVGTDPACVGGDAARLLVMEAVYARWFHDEPGLQGVAVALQGTGVDPAPWPLSASTYTDGTAQRTAYVSDRIPLPPGFEGTLTATLLRDGQPVEEARVHALPRAPALP